MSYFATPFDFLQVMYWLGEQIDGVPYQFTYTAIPTDSASYATNITWNDTKTQPSWAYLAPGGAGFSAYNSFFQLGTPIYSGQGDTALAAVVALIPAAQVQTDWNSTTGLGKILNKPTLSTVATSGAYSDLSGKPMLAVVATSGSYSDLSSKPTIPASQVNSDWNASTGLAQILNKPTLSAVATSGSYNDLLNLPAARSSSVQTRSLNSSFQPSSTRDSWVVYSVKISTTLSLSGGQEGICSLQTCSTSGGTYVEQSECSNGNTGSLTVGLNITQPLTQQVSCFVPAGYYVKLVTTNTTGTPTFTYMKGQETLL